MKLNIRKKINDLCPIVYIKWVEKNLYETIGQYYYDCDDDERIRKYRYYKRFRIELLYYFIAIVFSLIIISSAIWFKEYGLLLILFFNLMLLGGKNDEDY